MNAWKYEFYFSSRVEQDISLVRFVHSWDILVNTWNKFHISAHPCIILNIIAFLANCTQENKYANFRNFTEPEFEVFNDQQYLIHSKSFQLH